MEPSPPCSGDEGDILSQLCEFNQIDTNGAGFLNALNSPVPNKSRNSLLSPCRDDDLFTDHLMSPSQFFRSPLKRLSNLETVSGAPTEGSSLASSSIGNCFSPTFSSPGFQTTPTRRGVTHHRLPNMAGGGAATTSCKLNNASRLKSPAQILVERIENEPGSDSFLNFVHTLSPLAEMRQYELASPLGIRAACATTDVNSGSLRLIPPFGNSKATSCYDSGNGFESTFTLDGQQQAKDRRCVAQRLDFGEDFMKQQNHDQRSVLGKRNNALSNNSRLSSMDNTINARMSDKENFVKASGRKTGSNKKAVASARKKTPVLAKKFRPQSTIVPNTAPQNKTHLTNGSVSRMPSVFSPTYPIMYSGQKRYPKPLSARNTVVVPKTTLKSPDITRKLLRPEDFFPDTMTPRKVATCNCKKSKCLKLYCECFASGGYCGPDCNCENCANNKESEPLAKDAKSSIMIRNKNAFKPKIEKTRTPQATHHNGCNCKKTACLKKYCECFAAGVTCGKNCKCIDCKNVATTSTANGSGSVSRCINHSNTPRSFVGGRKMKPQIYVDSSVKRPVVSTGKLLIKKPTTQAMDRYKNNSKKPYSLLGSPHNFSPHTVQKRNSAIKKKIRKAVAIKSSLPVEKVYPMFGRKVPPIKEKICLNAMSYLNEYDLASSSLVNRLWNSFALDESIWDYNDCLK